MPDHPERVTLCRISANDIWGEVHPDDVEAERRDGCEVRDFIPAPTPDEIVVRLTREQAEQLADRLAGGDYHPAWEMAGMLRAALDQGGGDG